MGTTEWLQVLLVGAVAGAVGQLVRAIAGLAGANRTSAGQPPEAMDLSRLLISSMVGAAAGALAALTMNDKLRGTEISAEVILGLLAAGYAGADFIEGVAGKFGRGGGTPPLPVPAPAPAGAPIAPAPASPAVSAPVAPATSQTKPEPVAVG